MSCFSGKYDLFDAICMRKHRTITGSDKKSDLEKSSVLYNDELECFNIFKQETGGELYQLISVKDINEYNQDFIAKNCFFPFKIIKHKEERQDKRLKSGFRNVIFYTYEYCGKSYTKEQLKKASGVSIVKKIKFNTLLDLIPYYPYLVNMQCWNNNKLKIYISKESYVESSINDNLQRGFISPMLEIYKKDLQKHYLEVCKNYFLFEITTRTINIELDKTKLQKIQSGNYILKTDFDIDYMHDIEYIWSDNKMHTHWSSPKQVDHNIIEFSKQDIEYFLTAANLDDVTVNLRYIKVPNNGFPLFLD